LFLDILLLRVALGSNYWCLSSGEDFLGFLSHGGKKKDDEPTKCVRVILDVSGGEGRTDGFRSHHKQILQLFVGTQKRLALHFQIITWPVLV
jgi:hypothetical protein